MSDELRLKLALASKSSLEPEKTFEYLYNKYVNLLIFIASSILDNDEDIEDAVQESFTKFFYNAMRVKSNIRSYLSTICKNKALDILRQNKRIVVTDIELVDLLSDSNDIKSYRLTYLIADMKKHLNSQDVDIILSYLLNGESFKEIAARMNINKDAIKTRYYRGLKKYRREANINEEN